MKFACFQGARKVADRKRNLLLSLDLEMGYEHHVVLDENISAKDTLDLFQEDNSFPGLRVQLHLNGDNFTIRAPLKVLIKVLRLWGFRL